MVAPLIAIIAAVLCGALSSVIYALNERTLQNARNRTNRMAAKCDEMAQLIQEIEEVEMGCKSCKFYIGMGRCEHFYGCTGEEPMAKTTKRKTNNPNPDYVPPHGFGVINCSELSDALDRTFCPQRAPIDTAMSTIKHLSSLSCPNCGAPVRGRECEYCGTVFEHENELRPYYILEYQGKPVITTPDDSVNGIPRTVRHFNPKTHQWEWVAENPVKAVRTPPLPTKHGRW